MMLFLAILRALGLGVGFTGIAWAFWAASQPDADVCQHATAMRRNMAACDLQPSCKYGIGDIATAGRLQRQCEARLAQ